MKMLFFLPMLETLKNFFLTNQEAKAQLHI